MDPARYLLFPPFRLDTIDMRLWRGAQAIPLRPQVFNVLRYLVQRPDQLVTRAELQQTFWRDTPYQDPSGLSRCIVEIRQALGDAATAPQFIETVPRRGYRFVGKSQPGHPLVGRAPVFDRLHHGLAQALRGERQIVFVTGELGIGKTTVVEAFVQSLAGGDLWIATGRCVEHYGAGEAYLPVLEVLGQLCRAPGHEHLIALLRQHAPMWLVQMPALLSAADRQALPRELIGATQARMVRELAEAVDVLTTETPLVLVLEDLHWSDEATLNVLSVLARRREPARLLLLGTYRPEDATARGHPLETLVGELHTHQQCEQLALEALTPEAVVEYLAARFPQHQFPPALARLLHARTEGNPLFLVDVVNELLAQGVLVDVEGTWALAGALETVQQVVPKNEHQLIQLWRQGLRTEERQVLEVGSVVGMEFSAAAVAAGLAVEVTQAEEWLEAVEQHGRFLTLCGEEAWPDGTVAARYGFRHALYHTVVYGRLAAARRRQYHQRIGERLERGYAAQVAEIAAALAVHFERGQEYGRAVQYRGQAADNAMRRHAYQEARRHLTHGLELLKALPAIPERTQHELTLCLALGEALAAIEGYAALEVEHAYARAWELCQQLGETPQHPGALWGLWRFALLRGELREAQALGEQLLTQAQHRDDLALRLGAHFALGAPLFYLGDLIAAQQCVEQGVALYAPPHHRYHDFLYCVTDPGVFCHSYVALTQWLLGYPDQALRRIDDTLVLAQQLAHPASLAYALSYAAVVHQLRREGPAAGKRAEAAITLATEQSFALWRAMGMFLRGWARAEQGEREAGLGEMRQGLTAWLATGAGLARPYWYALLAEAYGKGGHTAEGLAMLAQARQVMDDQGQRFFEAELHRLQGELLLTLSTEHRPEAEACFRHARDVARHQQAKSLELRAAMSLARLWQRQGKHAEARQLLAEVYGWFAEGFDTADLQEAKALLAELT